MDNATAKFVETHAHKNGKDIEWALNDLIEKGVVEKPAETQAQPDDEVAVIEYWADKVGLDYETARETMRNALEKKAAQVKKQKQPSTSKVWKTPRGKQGASESRGISCYLSNETAAELLTALKAAQPTGNLETLRKQIEETL